MRNDYQGMCSARSAMFTLPLRRVAAGRAATVAAALALAGLPACDTEVTNPGPVQDAFLQDKAAQPALVNGMGRATAQGVNWIAYTGAAISREIHPSGSTGSFGITNRWQRGEMAPTDRDLNTHWEQAQRARWLAEDGIKRIESVGPTSEDLLAQAYLWAGYANRLLAENMCQAVIDGGAPEPNKVFFDRAEQWFTKAIDKATAINKADLKNAGLAGRASARVFLGKWPEAVADAMPVPDAFVYKLPYYDLGEDAQRNRIFFASAGTPYRAHTVWNTVNESYFKETKDPRVPFRETGQQGDAAIDCCGKVPWNPQTKHNSSAAPITLSSGWEMRLIEAEAKLRGGDFQGAMQIINRRRTALKVPTLTANNLTEGWTHLKRERAIELWLEGRRLGDLRRWKEGNTPGTLHPLELPSANPKGPGSHLAQQDPCFPIPPAEQETNPLVPKAT